MCYLCTRFVPVDDLTALGNNLRLSDLFRTYEMQRQVNLDYVEGRKHAYSPPPGGSMHEAGRAMDIDLSSMGVKAVTLSGRNRDDVAQRGDERRCARGRRVAEA